MTEPCRYYLTTKNPTSCIFSRDFRVTVPRFLPATDAASLSLPLLLPVPLTLSLSLSLSRRCAVSRARVWFTSSLLLIEFDARS